MSSHDTNPAVPLPERMKILRALLDRYESEGLQKLETPQYNEMAKALNAVWPKAYIVKTWYERAENTGKVFIGFLLGVFLMILVFHFLAPEIPATICPPSIVHGRV